jgi:hypothetical protein
MTKDEALKYMWIMICVADIWVGSWFMHEKCTAGTWWTLPSLLTLIAIYAVAFWKVIRKL